MPGWLMITTIVVVLYLTAGFLLIWPTRDMARKAMYLFYNCEEMIKDYRSCCEKARTVAGAPQNPELNEKISLLLLVCKEREKPLRQWAFDPDPNDKIGVLIGSVLRATSSPLILLPLFFVARDAEKRHAGLGKWHSDFREEFNRRMKVEFPDQ